MPKDANLDSFTDEVLMLDVYSPPDSDTRASRPAIVFAHGGGFKGGGRFIGQDLGEEMAKRGYVFFSISYRLTGEIHDPATQG